MLVVCCCTLFFMAASTGNTPAATVIPTPTNSLLDSPAYDALEETYANEIYEKLFLMVVIIDNSAFDIDGFTNSMEFSNYHTDIVFAYNNLRDLQPSSERKERHANIVKDLSACKASANWFSQAISHYNAGNDSHAINSLNNGYGYYGLCQENLDLYFE